MKTLQELDEEIMKEIEEELYLYFKGEGKKPKWFKG